MKITIVSAYTWLNKGDAAILLGTITELNEYFGEENLKFNILTFTPKIDEEKYRSIIPNLDKIESNIFNPYPIKKNKINKCAAIIMMGFGFFKLKIKQLFFRKAFISETRIQICDNSDLIVICGGGFLGGKKFNSLMHLCQINLLTTLKKPMILWGTSIEPPSNKLLQFITEKNLRKIDVIMPREEITERYLEEWYDKNKIIPTPDLAFKISNIKENQRVDLLFNEIEIKAKGRKIIGITMRNWGFPNSEYPNEAKTNYFDTLVSLINDLEKNNFFVFIPQVIMFGDDDRCFAFSVKNQIENTDSFLILEEDYSPYELKYLISKFNQFIGTRMHSNIFSSSVGIPIAIAYEKKTNGIMERLSLQEYVIDIENIDLERMKDLIYLNLKNKELIGRKTLKKVEGIKNEIRRATISTFDKIKI